MPRGPAQRIVALLMGIAAVTAAGCANGSASRDDRDTEIYDTALEWLLDHADVEAVGDDVPLVYVEHLGADSIALGVQVELIDRFATEAELRFVDARTEAVDESAPDAAVRDQRVLIGLGPVSDDDEVRAEIYRSEVEVSAFRLELSERDGWRLAGEPMPIEPVGLVADP